MLNLMVDVGSAATQITHGDTLLVVWRLEKEKGWGCGRQGRGWNCKTGHFFTLTNKRDRGVWGSLNSQ